MKKTVFDSLLELSGRGIPAEVEREGTKVSFLIIKPSGEIMDKYSEMLAQETDKTDKDKDFRLAIQYLLHEAVRDNDGNRVFETPESTRKIGFDLYNDIQKKVIQVLIERNLSDFETKNSEGSPSLEQQSPSQKVSEEGTPST